jgi:hypothetical protein
MSDPTSEDFDPAADPRFISYMQKCRALVVEAMIVKKRQGPYPDLAQFVFWVFKVEPFDVTDLFMRMLAACKAEGHVPTTAFIKGLFACMPVESVPAQHRYAYQAVCANISSGLCAEVTEMMTAVMKSISTSMGVTLVVDVQQVSPTEEEIAEEKSGMPIPRHLH